MTTLASAPSATGGHHLNLQLQAHQHPLVDDETFPSLEAYVSHLIHLKAYEKAAELAAGKDVLDVGCNVGYGVRVLLSAASFAAGIDVSPRAVEAARRRLGSRADIRCYDGVRCSFPSHSFDVVTSFQVVEHVSDDAAYFSEILRLLRPRGIALLTTPNACLRLDPGMKPWNEFHVREFSPPELQSLLTKWFDAVEVLGLFGEEEPYRIERNRLEAARTAARSPWKRSLRNLKRAAKRLFPQAARIRNMMRPSPRAQPKPAGIDRAQIDRFSTRQLFYKKDRLEDALDLMALCRVTR
jgi:SAM-dependent methyltransferase